MNETIDLNLIRAFATVAAAGSFTRAAERLAMPRATISRRVAQLERDLGVRLFQRTTRRVSLSTAGDALHRRLVTPLASIDDALRGVPELEAQPAGRLRITAPADVATAILPPIIAAFTRDHPAVSVDVHVTNAFVDLVAGGFDCALRATTRRLSDSSLVARKLGELPVKLYASPSYLTGRRVRSVDLEKYDWVVVAAQRPLNISRARHHKRIDVRGPIETDDMLFAHQATLQGAGIAALPAFLVARDVAAGRLVNVLPQWRAASGQLWMLWPGGKHLPLKTRAFGSAVAAALPTASTPLPTG